MISPQHELLTEFLNCDRDEIVKHSPRVYSWNGLCFEVLGRKTMLKGKTAPSHYTTHKWGGKEWSIRELGSKSKIRKEMKNAKAISRNGSKKDGVEFGD